MKTSREEYCRICWRKTEECECSKSDIAKIKHIKKSTSCPYCKSIQDVTITEGLKFIEISAKICFYCKKLFTFYSNDGHTEKTIIYKNGKRNE